MSSPAKQPLSQQQKKAGWGSLLSGAVAGLESRLDTMLADEPDASAKSKAAEQAGRGTSSASASTSNLAPPQPQAKVAKEGGGSRDASRTRANDRLAERLAKATAAKTPTPGGSAVPSRVGSPAIGTERASGEEKRPGSEELTRSVPDIAEPTTGEEQTAQTEAAKESTDKTADDSVSAPSARVSGDSSSRPSLDLPNGTSHTPKTNAELEAELSRLREAENQRQEEMHAYLEKIDALQAKLSYLANDTVAAAKAANAATDPEKMLAEKDERIALLMEEGEKLSKTELKHLQTIKKLRTQKGEDDRAFAESKKRESELRQRLRRAEVEKRQANEKAKQIAGIEKQVEELRVDRENAAELVKSLTVQLKEAKDRTAKAEKEARDKVNDVDKGRIARLENEIEDAQIERKLAEDRSKAEIRKVKEDLEGQNQRFSVRELELKNEIAALESRVEAMRSRAEEATASNGGTGGTGENSNVALLRQVETLQRQYALAKENWEAIEASLNGRVAAVERERDEAGRREGEARRKGREIGSKARRVEDELEGRVEEVSRLDQELRGREEAVVQLQKRLDESDRAAEDARVEIERQKRVWEAKVEEERMKALYSHGRNSANTARNESPLAGGGLRKTSAADPHSRRPGTGTGSNRLTSHDLAALHTETQHQRPRSRQSSGFPPSATRNTPLDTSSPPTISRQESTLSLTTTPADIPPTPSIEVDDHAPFPDNPNSPDRTINDLVSNSITTHAGAGPSVQLVERMSAAVRRLESEKAAFKDETSRLSSQRDSARDEVVALMREVEAKREVEGKLEGMEQLRGRYEASLEMLGEREEEVEELKGDVGELKRLYRELVEEKIGGDRK